MSGKSTPAVVLVSVGVGRYDAANRSSAKSKLPELRHAEADAEAVTQAFREFFDPALDGALVGPHAVVRRVNKAISMIETGHAEADAAVFYFSGHGQIQNAIVNDGEARDCMTPDLFLHCYHAEGLDSYNDSLPMHSVVARLTEIPARNYVIVIDACRTTSRGLAKETPSDLFEQIENRLAAHVRTRRPGASFLMLMSCAPGEASLEDDRSGLFTGVLLDEWKQAAGRCENWESLFGRVRFRVSNRSNELAGAHPKRYGGFAGPQIPQSFPRNLERFEMDLGQRVLVRPATLRPTSEPTPSAQKAKAASQLWIAIAQGPAELPQPAPPITGPFRISRLPVLRDEYEWFVDRSKWPDPPREKRTARRGKFAALVDFAGAEAFCEWFRYRLPSDVEWDRAARNGSLEMPGDVIWEWVDSGRGRNRIARTLKDLASRGEHPAEYRSHDLGFRYVDASSESNPPVDGLDECVRIPRMANAILGVPRRHWPRDADRIGLDTGEAAALAADFGSRAASVDAFSIRRHPVTNEEFHEFAKYQKQYWPPSWRTEFLRLGTASHARPFLDKYRYHPVAGVSYEGAEAYCKWRRVRLPKGDEWEVAARGEHGHLYPWGNSFHPHRANFSGMGLGRTLRVDALHSGQSDHGCLDMAGNVWEWTAEDREGRRLLRGGSFEDDGRIEGLAFYKLEAPPGRRPLAGFRYVLE